MFQNMPDKEYRKRIDEEDLSHNRMIVIVLVGVVVTALTFCAVIGWKVLESL